jgi:hypothetical protein
MKNIETYKRQSVFLEIDDQHNFVEITDWYNGEGKDIQVSGAGNRNQSISLTHEEFAAIMVAWNWNER